VGENMKKYFEIELRIGNIEEHKNENTNYYFGNGALSIENNKIEGYVGCDYLEGGFDNNILLLKLYDFDMNEIMTFTVEIQEEDFTFPNIFSLLSLEYEDEYAILDVKSKSKVPKEECILQAKDMCRYII